VGQQRARGRWKTDAQRRSASAASRFSSSPGGRFRVPRQGLFRRRAAWLAFERLPGRSRPLGRGLAGPPPLAGAIVPLGCLAGPHRGPSFPWRLQLDAGAPGLGQANGDRLLRRPGPVPALTHVLDLLAHELAGLRGWGFAVALRLSCPLECFLLRHAEPFVRRSSPHVRVCMAVADGQRSRASSACCMSTYLNWVEPSNSYPLTLPGSSGSGASPFCTTSRPRG
jgi:hypothetical protein